MRVHTHGDKSSPIHLSYITVLGFPLLRPPLPDRITLRNGTQGQKRRRRNLIKFLLLSRSRADRFITALSLFFLIFHFSSISSKLNFLRINYRNTFSRSLSLKPSFVLCDSHKSKSQKCFSVLHKLIESIVDPS